jgi:hypothetical protein
MQLLAERYGFWNDDLPHPDPFHGQLAVDNPVTGKSNHGGIGALRHETLASAERQISGYERVLHRRGMKITSKPKKLQVRACDAV